MSANDADDRIINAILSALPDQEAMVLRTATENAADAVRTRFLMHRHTIAPDLRDSFDNITFLRISRWVEDTFMTPMTQEAQS